MKTTATPVLLMLGLAFVSGNAGCVRGMTYKMPMPESLTLGTIKEEDAALASARRTPPDRRIAGAVP